MFGIRIPSNFLQIFVDWIVSNVENILIRATPLLAPIPSAFAINYALHRAGWPGAAWLGGIIEALGLCAGATMGGIAMFNSRYPKRAIHPKIGYVLFGFYVLVAVLIVGGYETLPTLSHWLAGQTSTSELIKSVVPLLFPGLTLIGSVIVALREYMQRAADEAKHEQERTEANQDAAQRRQDAEFELSLEIKRQEAAQRLTLQQAEHEQRLEIERQKAAAKLSKSVAKTVAIPVAETSIGNTDTPAISENATQRRNVLLNLLQQHGDVGDTEFGRKLGVDRTTVYRDFQVLAKNRLVHKNGHGWEVNKDAAH